MATKGKAWTEPHEGAWRVRAVVDGKRKTISGGHATEAVANLFRDAWNLELEKGGIESADQLTLAKVGETWLASRELHGSRKRAEVKSIKGERSVWRTHVEPSPLSKMHPGSIRVRDIEAFALWLRGRTKVSATIRGSGFKKTIERKPTKDPLSVATQREALRLVRGALDEAVRNSFIATNPAAKVGVAPGGRRPRDLSEDWLRADEIDRLLACEALPIKNRTAYACAIGLALRLNDLKSIEVAHVHLDAEVPGPHVRVWIGKTEKWHQVPIAAWLDPWLRRHLATLPKTARYVFTHDDGERFAQHYEFAWAGKVDRGKKTQQIMGALERAGIKRKIRFHDLRGTTATHLALGTWGRRWSLHEVQMMLAHSDQRVTERYVRRAIDSLAEAMKATRGGPSFSPPSDSPTLPEAISDEPANSATSLDSGTWTRTRDQSVNSSGAPAAIASTYVVSGSAPGSAAEVAQEVLATVASRRPLPAALVERLVGTVLGREEVQLALAIRDGGPTVVRRAIELAALVVAADVVETSGARSCDAEG